MKELGMESSLVKAVLDGKKTVEGRLGKPEHLKIKSGDIISIREDVYKDSAVSESHADVARIRVGQVLYFDTFREMLESLGHANAIPSSKNVDQAMGTYRKFYSPKDEEEYGVVAILFANDPTSNN